MEWSMKEGWTILLNDEETLLEVILLKGTTMSRCYDIYFHIFNAKKNINLDLVCCGVLCFVISITAQCFNFIFCCDYLTRLSIMVSMLACPRCSELPSEWLSNRFFMMAMVCSTNCVLVSLMGTWKNGKPQRKCQ